MTAEEFRRLALGFPGAIESAHMNHPDFRAAGRIFASLGAPDEQWGMVKLTPEQQEAVMKNSPLVFRPSSGAWGRGGCTQVLLSEAKAGPVRSALELAWKNVTKRKAKK